MAATKRQRFVSPDGLLRCSDCKELLAVDKFLTITVRDKRCKPGHSWTGPSVDCRECRNEKKRLGRQRTAEAAGRRLRAKGEWQAQQKAESQGGKEIRRQRRLVAWSLCLAFWVLVRLSPEERARRSVARQRHRYNTDPVYQAQRKATKIRRKRAQKGTQVVPINRELVAARDGWRCGICRGVVTRETWSLDHVVPLSKGGSHTYDNVVLAHRGCNSRRGPGRLPVQGPLFAMLPPPIPVGSSPAQPACGLRSSLKSSTAGAENV